MRPVQLTLQAFGPFAAREVIDFSEALDAGLFGIYGPTGAGKTSIFDGLCFALFGESAGRERQGSRMRSDYAGADTLTEARLVFDLGEKRYVIHRIPEQERASRRGGGTTKQLHTADLFDATGLSLEEIDGGALGAPLAERRTREVTNAIEELLGYDADQFRQIVLLPQGDFRRILTADTDQRSEILKKLFDVTLYQRLMHKLKDDAKELRDEISRNRQAQDTLLRQHELESPDALSHRIAEEQAEADELVAQAKTAATALKAAEAAHLEAMQLDAQFKEHEAAAAAVASLSGQSAEIEELRRRLDGAHRANSLEPERRTLEGATRAEKEAEKRSAEHARKRNDALQARDASKALWDQELQKEPERQAATDRVATLNRFVDILRNAEAHSETLAAKREALRTSTASLQRAEAQLLLKAAEPQRLADLLKQARFRAEERAKAVQRLTETDGQLKAYDAYHAAKKSVDESRRELNLITTAQHTAQREREAAFTALSNAEAALSEAQALHLALKLEPETPCPVCGSKDHPAPAAGTIESEGRNDAFETARDALSSAEIALRNADQAAAAASARLEERQNALNGLAPPENERAALLERRNEASKKAAPPLEVETVPHLEGELDAAQVAARDAQTKRDTAREAASEAATEHDVAEARLNQALAEVPEDLRDQAALSRACADAKRHAEDLAARFEKARTGASNAAEAFATADAALRAATEEVERLGKLRRDAEAAFAGALEEKGVSPDDYALALEAIPEIDDLTRKIAEYGQNLAASKARQQRAADDIEGKLRPDVSLLATARQNAVNAEKTAHERVTRKKAHLEQLTDTKTRIDALNAKLSQLESKFGPVGELSNLVNGDNDLKLRLSDFAIAALLDDILAAANLRLRPMTDNRFELRRRQGEEGGRGKRGLDLDVFDAYTASTRPTTDISGGESFKAALALALGMSDIIQQTAGGIRLDAIFIDEGFGSLDEDSLEAVLDTLRSLTGENRAVGVVSHLEPVKQAINAGFAVDASPGGSRVRKLYAA